MPPRASTFTPASLVLGNNYLTTSGLHRSAMVSILNRIARSGSTSFPLTNLINVQVINENSGFIEYNGVGFTSLKVRYKLIVSLGQKYTLNCADEPLLATTTHNWDLMVAWCDRPDGSVPHLPYTRVAGGAFSSTYPMGTSSFNTTYRVWNEFSQNMNGSFTTRVREIMTTLDSSYPDSPFR